MKNLNKILLIVAIMLVSQPSISFSTETSAGKYTVLAPLPCIESAPTTYTDSNGQTQTNPGITCEGNGSVATETEVDFKTYVQYTMNLLIALSAVVAVVMLVWGGIEYMFTSSFSSKKSGLERAKNALVGLLLVLTSYIILRTVDPRLVEIPNTLVPKITIEKWLQENVRDSFTQNLETEISEYDKRRTGIGEKMTETKEKKDSYEKEISDLEADIAWEETSTSTDEAKIKNLKLKLEIAREGYRQEQVVYIVEKASSSMNGNLDEIAKIALEPADSSWYEFLLHEDGVEYEEGAEEWSALSLNTKDNRLKTKIRLMNNRISKIHQEYNVATKELSKVNAFDNPTLKEQRNYFVTMAKLHILGQSIYSITTNSVEEQKYRLTHDITYVSTDGTLKAQDRTVIKNSLQTEINNLQTFINVATDPSLKEKMTSQKAVVEKQLAEKLP